jgi:hypothetical protein
MTYKELRPPARNRRAGADRKCLEAVPDYRISDLDARTDCGSQLWNRFAALKASAAAGNGTAATAADRAWDLWLIDFIPDAEQRRAVPRPQYSMGVLDG